MASSYVLGIETSGARPQVALLADGQLIAQRSVPMEGSRRSSALIVEVDAACRAAGITSRQLELVSVSIGPGSFTGLRIGVTFAKTLAYTVGCPVVGISSLHAAAESVDPAMIAATQMLHVVADAQRGEVFYQPFYRASGGVGAIPSATAAAWEAEGSREIAKPLELASRLPTGSCLVGPGIKRYSGELLSQRADLILHDCEPSTVSVARLGISCRDVGQQDAWSLLPDYGRLSSAEEKRGDRAVT